MALQGSKSGIGTTAVPLSSTSRPFAYGVRLKARGTNANPIWIGLNDPAVSTTTGWRLLAGDEMPVPVNITADVSQIFAVSNTNVADPFLSKVDYYGE